MTQVILDTRSTEPKFRLAGTARSVSLGPLELAVVQELTLCPTAFLTRHELTAAANARLHEEHSVESVVTVISNVRSKLDTLAGLRDLIETRRGVGYAWMQEESTDPFEDLPKPESTPVARTIDPATPFADLPTPTPVAVVRTSTSRLQGIDSEPAPTARLTTPKRKVGVPPTQAAAKVPSVKEKPTHKRFKPGPASGLPLSAKARRRWKSNSWTFGNHVRPRSTVRRALSTQGAEKRRLV